MVLLGDISRVVAGQSPESKFYNKTGEGLPFYQGKKDFGERHIEPPTVWTREGSKIAEADDILMSVRAPVGPVNIATQRCCIGRGLAAIRSGNKVDNNFLYYFLQSIQNDISGNAGAVFASINKSQIMNIGVPLPPLDEQKRIVAKLDEAMKLVSDLDEKLFNRLKLTKETVDDLQNSLFADNRESQVAIGKVADVRTGPFGSVLHKADYANEGVPLVNPINMVNGNIRVDKYVKPSVAASLDSYWLKARDVVVARRGELGRCVVVGEEHEGWLCGTGSFFIRPSDSLHCEFLALTLSAPKTVQRLEALSSGTTMSNLSNSTIASLEISVPDIQKQKAKLLRWHEINNLHRQAKGSMRKKHILLKALKNSLLASAFAGEL
jgi:type I restriction enzyme S subunit